MKRFEKRLIFSVSLVVFCLGYFTVRHYATHNISDEVYYNQECSLGTPVLESLEVITNPVSDNTSGGNRGQEIYDLDSLPSGVVDIEYSFNFSDEHGDNTQFTVVVKQFLAGDSTEVTASYIYHSRAGILDRILWVKGETSGLTSSKEDVIDALEKNGTTYKKFARKSDSVLEPVVLKDRCPVYNGRYSPDN